MNNLVSIVIPIYNVEEFLEKCLNSIKKQSYNNFEAILIDDGSKDKSKTICQKFTEQDDRFKYIYQKNAGVSTARNNGIQNATGEFITFVDGDDYLDKNHIEEMVNGLKKSDLVISGRKNIIGNIVEESFTADSTLTLTQKELVDYILKKGLVYSFPWNKMYKMQILKENYIDFDHNLDYGEDLVFNMQYALLIQKSTLITGSTYNYVYRKDSVSNQLNERSLKKRVTDLLSVRKVIEMLPSDYSKEQFFLNKRIVIEGTRYIRLMYQYNFPAATINQYARIIKVAYEEVKSKLSYKRKLIYYGSLKFPRMFNYLSNLKKHM